MREPTTDEQLLSALSKQLRESTVAASKALDMGLAAAEKTRKMIKNLHNEIPTSEVAV